MDFQSQSTMGACLSFTMLSKLCALMLRGIYMAQVGQPFGVLQGLREHRNLAVDVLPS